VEPIIDEVKMLPPSVESSILTFPTDPVVTHVMYCDEPVDHSSFPFGDVTVNVLRIEAWKLWTTELPEIVTFLVALETVYPLAEHAST
jgi:hypothetical protein